MGGAWLVGDNLIDPGSPGKSQEEGQEDQGEVNETRGGAPPAVSKSPGPPGLPSSSSLGFRIVFYSVCALSRWTMLDLFA